MTKLHGISMCMKTREIKTIEFEAKYSKYQGQLYIYIHIYIYIYIYIHT